MSTPYGNGFDIQSNTPDADNIIYNAIGFYTLPDTIFLYSYERNNSNKNTPIFQSNSLMVRNRSPDENECIGQTSSSSSTSILSAFDKKSIAYDIDSIDYERRNRDITKDEFDSLLKDLEEFFIIPFKEKTSDELRLYTYDLWNLTELHNEGMVEINDIQKGYDKNLSLVLKYYRLFLRHKMIGKETHETLCNQNMFNRVLKTLYYLNNLLIDEYQIRKNVVDENFLNQEDTLNLTRFTPQDYSKNKPFQNLVVFLLNRAYQKGYRLYRESCHKQIYHNKYPTHAWEHVMPVTDFVYKAITRETNFEMWQNLLDSKDNASSAAKYLINGNDKELPTLQPDRHVFAFSDGIYDTQTLEFFKYETCQLPSNVVAVKFFNQEFDSDRLFAYDDWYDIPTPYLQNILDDQQLPVDVCKVMYAFMGRCFYDVNEKDRWEVVMFIKGIAGSGKSTIGSTLKNFYPNADVFSLSSNIEKKFGLAAIYDKLLYLCLEVKKNWGLDQADFQMMMSGEEITVAIKHKTAVSIMWKVPGMLFGNESADSWLDAAGSMSRRIVLLEFLKKVKNVDTNLSKKIKENIASIIHKCNMAYHNMLFDVGTASIWDKLPQYFQDTRKKLSATINPLEDFLSNSDHFSLDSDDPNCCIPFDEFRTMYMKFVHKEYNSKIRFNEDHYRTVFENKGIVVKVVEEKMYGESTRHNIKWIFGITLRDNNSFIAND